MINTQKSEFDGMRAKLYNKAILSYPDARSHDIQAMHEFLRPQRGEKILGVGEGNGYFCRAISDAIGPCGEYVITDPSKDQLGNISRFSYPNTKIQQSLAEKLAVHENYFDKIWSFGALHHCKNQGEAINKMYKSLKIGGYMVLCDVFEESRLANHFDTFVAKYCITGHSAKFFSDESAKAHCIEAGFTEKNIHIWAINQKWQFQSENDLGNFIYLLHALTLLPGTKEQKIAATVNSCKDILGIEKKEDKYLLNWPMKALIAKK